MKPLIFEVTQVGAGTLCIMPRPNADHLPEAFAFLKQLSIHKVVCLMETAEMEAYGLAEEAAQCSAAGLTFTHFPIPDHQTPNDDAAFHALVETLHTDLAAGVNTTIHCWAGIGRTGVVAGCILKHAGNDARTAMALLTAARGWSVPETEAQCGFIEEFMP